LFTDLEVSTRLWEEHPEEMKVALKRHDEIVRSAIESHRGHVVKATGDGFHGVFHTAHDAIDAALDARAALSSQPWPETGPLRVRMGIHTGETQERDGDYFGPAVNRAARVMSVAHGGQIVASRAAVEVVGESVPVRSLGQHRLRDLGAPLELFQVGGGVFPPLRSVDVVPTNLPSVRTELIGRSDDVRELSELVRQERLVTLTGVGGVGKTRLALAVAAAIAADFADGCWLVELAPVAGNDEVIAAVAGSMRAPATDLDALATYLAERHVLLVLDNCEHVLDIAVELVDVVLTSGLDLHVLVTSREPLGLDGEQVRRVRSLDLPESDATLDRARLSGSVRLFAERAGAAADGFTVDADNVDEVVEICRHLDGIPLAIELAAARVRAMPPAEITRRLDERFRLLAGGSRRSQERHRTLQSTVAWSHDLCSDDEKAVFRRLAVFPTTFDLDAAEAVARDGVVDVVESVLHLVDRSLIDYDPDSARYRLLETLRQYGTDRLADVAETQSIRERHARWFLALTKRVGPGLGDDRVPIARRELGVEIDNLRAAMEWCSEVGSWSELAAMSLQLWTFFEQDAPVDGAIWLTRVLEHASALEPQVVVDTLGVLAWIYTPNLGDVAQGDARAEQSLTLSAQHDLDVSPWAHLARGMGATFKARHAEAMNHYELALDASEQRGDERAAVVALCVQIGVLGWLGEAERSATIAAEAMRRAELTGNATLVSAAIVSWCSAYTQHCGRPDFAASLNVLARHDVGLRSGTMNDMWLDIFWGEALLGLSRPGAVEYLARGARSADRLGNPQALDWALRVIAIAASEADLVSPAATLANYAETSLSKYRWPGQDWIQSRLDHALERHADQPSRPEPHRRDIINLVDELQAAFAEPWLGLPQQRHPNPHNDLI
jgi:predicted ATPase